MEAEEDPGDVKAHALFYFFNPSGDWVIALARQVRSFPKKRSRERRD